MNVTWTPTRETDDDVAPDDGGITVSVTPEGWEATEYTEPGADWVREPDGSLRSPDGSLRTWLPADAGPRWE